eukprot:CAMPEP_0185728740 /NCGR_PEP_ID=MMETSP1171-20130828/4108_1 /TAXON_ID=374046 /ORGANISM="Helicotheca tamensis, Strain CCMP826" /LENGTH=459 /DNA_ID=CAMNT_0028397481 /DNA_START=260 /DNA_END=1636 /DNA_ORIENTATION=+
MGLVFSFAKGVAAGVGFCFCSAIGSLFSSCLGNDKPSTIPPSATSGRRRSVFLLIVSIGLAFAFQYGIAPALQPGGSTAADLPVSGDYLTDAWTSGCNDFGTDELREKCSGNSGVYRVAGSTTFFFLLAALSAYCKPSANREAWPAKYFLFLCLVAGTIFIPNDPLFDPIYMQLARVGGVIFVFFQQLILIDLAYNWNESWVEKADKAELEEGVDQGKKWLAAILVSCAIFYIGSIVVISLMYVYFSGCASNEAFISVTLAMSVIVTAVQLSGEESSLLTSAIIVAYSTYLCYTAVSRNPNDECNPQLGDEDILGIVLGIGLCLLSLTWTGWSFTAHSKLEGTSNPLSEDSEGEDPGKERGETIVKGVVSNQPDYGTNGGDVEDAKSSPEQTGISPNEGFSSSWKLNVILALVSCWYAMALTGWGAIETGGNAANPDVGKASMWMIIASQWLVLTLYLW